MARPASVIDAPLAEDAPQFHSAAEDFVQHGVTVELDGWRAELAIGTGLLARPNEFGPPGTQIPVNVGGTGVTIRVRA